MASYDKFAQQYSDAMSERGDFFHRTQIDPHIYKIIGNPKGKWIYDLGCGNGYMARNFAKKGAHVVASDISKELINIAKEKSDGLDIAYSVRDGSDFRGLGTKKFDVVIMNMVINYIKDIDTLVRGISRILKPNGIVVFTTNHFLRPAYPYSEWVKGVIFGKETLFIKTTGYLKDIRVRVDSGWGKKTKLSLINRSLHAYVNTLAKYGLFVHAVYEPESKGFATQFSKALQKSHHIPTYIIIGATKIRQQRFF